jgi:hypothetical protein
MSSSFLVLTPVVTEPISLAQAKAYLRVDFTDEDQVIGDAITRARSEIEKVTHRALATQQIQCVYTIDRPTGGEMSGPINEGPNWYQFQQQLGANPFGAAQFYFDLPQPPIQPGQTLLVETRVTVFDLWEPFTGSLMTLDNNMEPARLYFQSPVTANQWRFTYWAGYDATLSYPIPPDLLQPLYSLVAHFYENREGQDIPPGVMNGLLSRRTDWI